MAFNDIEVEVKFSVSETDFKKIKNVLKEIAKFDKISEQSDQYFNLANRSFLDFKQPFEWLSLRKRGEKKILNYKNWHYNNKGEFTHCDEFETGVEDLIKLEKIFSLIDLKNLVLVEKERETYNYQNEFEIALDTVKELGYFIEIEALADLGGIEETRKKILNFAAKNLGINLLKEVNKGGYAYLMMQKKGLIS